VNRHHHLARLPLDMDIGDRRMPHARLEILPQQLVFLQELREIPVRVPPRTPLLGDAQPKADRIGLLSHTAMPPSCEWPAAMRLPCPRPSLPPSLRPCPGLWPPASLPPRALRPPRPSPAASPP